MIIRLLKYWNGCDPGTVLNNISPPVGELLIQRGVAEVVVEKKSRPTKKRANAT